MEIEDLLKQLPDHWEMWTAEESAGVWFDSCREDDKPIFIRKDGLARIYFCSLPSDDCVFSIVFDYHSDGECRATLDDAIKYCDWYTNKFPLEYHNCKLCNNKAIWSYMPSESEAYYCATHVPRGCSCNADQHGNDILEDENGILRELPCCEYHKDEYGFPKID